MCLEQHLLIVHADAFDRFGYNGLDHILLAQPEEGSQLKHLRVVIALGLGQPTLGLQGGLLQAHQLALRDMADLPFRHGNVVELVGILQVLLADRTVLSGQQQVEVMIDGGERHLFDLLHEGGLRLLVAHRLDTTFPLLVVHTEDRLRERQAHRHTHELVVGSGAQLTGKVEGGIEGDLTAGQGNVLLDGDLPIQSQGVVRHVGVGAVRLLVLGILLIIGGQCAGEQYLRQLVCPMGAILPIGRAQLIACHGSIHRMELCPLDGLLQGQPQGSSRFRPLHRSRPSEQTHHDDLDSHILSRLNVMSQSYGRMLVCRPCGRQPDGQADHSGQQEPADQVGEQKTEPGNTR